MEPEGIEGPVIIDEHGDIEVFRSGAVACAHLESIDVDNGEFEAFDDRIERSAP